MKNTIKKYHQEKFWDDYSENFTDDIPMLRYEGPIPVFLYGHYATFDWMHKFMAGKGLRHNDDFRLLSGRACTLKERLYLNQHVPLKDEYNSFLLPPVCSVKDRKHLTKNKVRGSIFTVSLKGIRALDFFFRQGSNFYRDTVKLQQDVSANYKSAYTYVVAPKLIAENPDQEELVFKKQYNLVAPNMTSDQTGGKVYL